MAIEAERNGHTLIARADDRVDGSNARSFQSDLETVIEESDKEVILDFQNLSYISSAGLRAVLLTAKAMRRQETKFAVCCLSDTVLEVFQISGFDKIISIHPTLPEAIDYLHQASV